MQLPKKHYNTAGRVLLIEYLAAAAHTRPQSAEEIYRGLQLAGHAPGRSSVYRLISALCEEGQLRRARDAGNGSFLYQYTGGGHACRNHFHLQCLSCGAVVHLECGCSTDIAAHLQDHHGFVVDSGRSVLYGTCADCQKSQKNRKDAP